MNGENSMVIGAEDDYEAGHYNGVIYDVNESDLDYLENQDEDE